MILTQQELDQLNKLQPLLFLYVNQSQKVVQSVSTPQEIRELPTKDRIAIRDVLYRERGWIIDAFLKEQGEQLSDEEIALVASWKDQVKGNFFILKQLKSYAKVLSQGSEAKAYGIYSWHYGFDAMFNLPVMTEMVLLPFKGKIVYDGFITSQNISFGATITKSFNSEFALAQSKYGLITSLPYVQNNQQEEELLKFYAKNEENRYYYANEITKIISKNETLKAVYYQEVSKANSRHLSKLLREADIESGYFAILDNVIVASGKSKTELQKRVKEVVPPKRVDHVYIYQLKKRQ